MFNITSRGMSVRYLCDVIYALELSNDRSGQDQDRAYDNDTIE